MQLSRGQCLVITGTGVLVSSISISLDFPPARQGSPGPAPGPGPAASQGTGNQLGFPQAEVTSCLPAFKSFTKFCLCCWLGEGFVLSLSPKPTTRRTKAHRQQLTSNQLTCTLPGRALPVSQSPWLTRHMLTRQELLSNIRFPCPFGFMLSSTQLWAPRSALPLPSVPWLTLPWRSVAPGS